MVTFSNAPNILEIICFLSNSPSDGHIQSLKQSESDSLTGPSTVFVKVLSVFEFYRLDILTIEQLSSFISCVLLNP